MKKLKRKRYWLRYGIIGFIIGMAHHLILFMVQDSKFFLNYFYGAEFYVFCKIFNVGIGEPCGWAVLFWIPIIYAIIGALLGLLVNKYRK